MKDLILDIVHAIAVPIIVGVAAWHATGDSVSWGVVFGGIAFLIATVDLDHD